MIGGLRGEKYGILVVTKETREGTYAMLYISALDGQMTIHLVFCFHASPQTFPPKAADTVVFAPLLHHPGFELIFDDFPLVDIRRRILFLPTFSLGLMLQPLDLES